MLFIHDHTFIIDNGKYYTTGSLNQKIMDRYKKWFGNVTVLANYKLPNENNKNYIKIENNVKGLDFKLIAKKNRISNLIKACSVIKSEVKKADCIVIRMSIFGAIGVYYAKKYNKKYLIEMVACPWDSLWYHSLKGKILAPFMTILTKKICKEASYVLYVTDEFLQKRYPTNGKSIGCSDVELTKHDNNILENRHKKINSMNEKNIRLCTLANVETKYKGQDVIFKSIKQLNKVGINCEYCLIGGGNNTRLKKIAKKEKIEKNIYFVGAKPHEDVFELLDNIDVYVQPSYQEGLPRAVIEAMSRACPIITSNAGGNAELINSKCVFRKGKYKEFVKIIKNLTKEKLIEYSTENFEKSMKYEKKYLDDKREKFYMEFYKG